MKILNVVEGINLIYFSAFIVLSWFWRMDFRAIWKVHMIGFTGILITIGGYLLDIQIDGPQTPVIRNLLPALLMVFAYWQTGHFYSAPNVPLQEKLLSWDKKIARILGSLRMSNESKKWLSRYLEAAYLLCYPMVPMGVAMFYLMRLGSHAIEFWTIVIPPSYFCYAMVPFTRTLPPRTLEKTSPVFNHVSGKLRSFNMVIIRHASIQINTFPSAHAAASMAVALALLHFVPVAGWIFLLLAVSIAVAAAAGRYHFTADVVIGAGISLIWYLLLRM